MKYELSDKYRDVEEQLKKHGNVKVSELTERLFISEATVRRILTAMERRGIATRYYGGAKLADPELLSSVKRRGIRNLTEKAAIGELAASFVEDGMTILMMGGSTVSSMCPFIEHKRLTVITNSLPVLNTLAWSANIQLILLGGVLNSTEMEVRGQMTEFSMSRLRADIMFLGTCGVHPYHGIMTDDPNSIGTYGRCFEATDKVFVLADNTKFTHMTGTSSIYGIKQVRHIITDDRTPGSYRSAYSQMGIEVHIASVPPGEEI